MDTLTLQYAHRPGESDGNGFIKTSRTYIDFIVSGQPLSQYVESAGLDLIGALGWIENNDYRRKQISEFLGREKPELATGRTSFYVCPQCGDIGCGAITARIVVTDRLVIWQHFGYETDYSEPDLTGYQDIGPFTFDKAEYVRTLEQLR